MAKSIHSDVLDGALDILRNNANKLVACSAEPTTFNEANVTFKLGEVAIAPADMTKANGTVSGRKLTFAQKASTVGTSGTVTHVAAIDTVNSRLLLVTTCASQALTAGNPLQFNSFADEIRAPT